MTDHINTDTGTNEDTSSNCRTWLGVLQIALGLLLVAAAAFAYSLMNHLAVTLPALMGAVLLFFGTKAVLVCRNRTVFGDHPHQPAA